MNLRKEKALYEALGVVSFRNVVMSGSKKSHIFKEHIANQGVRNLSMDGFVDYQKKLAMNAAAHGIGGLCLLLPLKDGDFTALIPMVLNGYFVMLQRYQWIRIELVKEQYASRSQVQEPESSVPFSVPKMKSAREIRERKEYTKNQLIRVKK